MQINATFDASADQAPAYFKAAVAQAVSNLDAAISGSVTLDIGFSWGSTAALPVSGAASNSSQGAYFSYDAVKAALGAKAGDYASATTATHLPDADPTQGGGIYVTNAQAKSLGLGAPSGTDGQVAVNSSVNWAANADGSVGAGQYDLVAAIENQITAVMGRASITGGAGNNQYSVLDLLRYDPSKKAGNLPSDGYAHDLAPGAASLSFDGNVMKQQFADPATGANAADWSSATQADVFSSSYAGVRQYLTGTDMMEMSAIGWSVNGNPSQSLVTGDQNTGGTANAGKAIVAGDAFLGHDQSVTHAANPVSLGPTRSTAPVGTGNVTVNPSFDGFSFSDGTLTLSGSLSSDGNRQFGVEMYDGSKDIGAAQGSSLGGWTFSTDVSGLGDGTHAFSAKVTTSDGSVVGTGTAPVRVTTGIQGMPYQTEVDTLDASGGATHKDMYKSNGADWLSVDVSQLGGGLTQEDATGGTLFDHVHYTAMSVVRGQDGSVLERSFTGGDGTPDGSEDGSRFVNAGMHDVYRFSAAPGERTVADFVAGGDQHSVLNLSSGDFAGVADVLRHTTMSDAGATIHISPTDSVTLAGVTKGELAHNRGDFAFHS